MPEMRFLVRWPDGQRENCYSPSLVVRDFLTEGADYEVAEFLDLARQALTTASERCARQIWFSLFARAGTIEAHRRPGG